MLVGTVVGQVWATRKEATLEGLRLLVIQPYLTGGGNSAETIVAVDPLGADVGERVLVVSPTTGARLRARSPGRPYWHAGRSSSGSRCSRRT